MEIVKLTFVLELIETVLRLILPEPIAIELIESGIPVVTTVDIRENGGRGFAQTDATSVFSVRIEFLNVVFEWQSS